MRIYKKTTEPLKPWLKQWLFFIVFLCLAVTVTARTAKKQENQPVFRYKQDTIPAKKQGGQNIPEENCQKSLERSLENMEKARERLEDRFRQVDWDRVNREIEKSIKELDLEKILNQTNKTVQQALENIDFKKLEERIEQSLRKAGEKLNNPVFQKNTENLLYPEINKTA
jgi:hypothetical protein